VAWCVTTGRLEGVVEVAVLVCGGAGYIGSHTVKALLKRKEEVIVLDNFQQGHTEAVDDGALLYNGDLRDEAIVEEIFLNHKITSVIHFAANSLVAESVRNPLSYYDNNLYGTLCLVKAMNKYGVKQIVFSSTAAVYGDPVSTPILETDPTHPTNPYGETKLATEKMLKWCAAAYNMQYIILRYFNAAGADMGGEIGEDHNPETHLIPLVLQAALRKREKIMIYGDDYDTRDGTCIRDYIHVDDLASAHVVALEKLRRNRKSGTYNLGTEKGFSVKEVIDAARKVTGVNIVAEKAARRTGDPAVLIASSAKAKKELEWKPKHESLEEIITSAWRWFQKYPEGYKSKSYVQ
jgi:UDP-glucose 4-epimerase